MSDSGHLLDALRGRQPDDEDPERRLASQWSQVPGGPSSIEREAALRRARLRRPAGNGGEADGGELRSAEVAPSSGAYAPEAEPTEVKRTRIAAAPEPTRPRADEPKRGAFGRLGSFGSAVASAFAAGRSSGEVPVAPARGAGAAPDASGAVAAPASAPARGAKPPTRGKVQLSHSEALLFVLVALVVVLSAYVIGKNTAGETLAGERPPALSRTEGDGVTPKPVAIERRPIVVPPQPEPKPVVPPSASESWGVSIAWYRERAEAEKQAGVLQKSLGLEQLPIVFDRQVGSTTQHHVVAGKFDKKEDPALAALLQKIRTFALSGDRKPYARSAELVSF
jgi:hypothetical protein